ncbi:MAG: glycosyltransferase family 4 protein [Thaumarchaeota archaeon]|nr:glycosyltransferase family 4 protein [Nitrososphaerota archaeon]
MIAPSDSASSVATAGIRSILFLTYHFPPEIGGIHTRISHYVSELRRRGIRVTVFVITTHGSRMERQTTPDGADIVTCPGQLQYFSRNAFDIAQAVIAEKVDVIHVFTGASTVLGSFALVLGRALRIPVAISFFGKEQFEIGNLMQRALLPFALNVATTIGVNTPYTGGFIPGTLQRKVHVLLGGAEMAEPVEAGGSSQNGTKRDEEQGWKTILFVGRLIHRKGGDDLIDAFRSISKEFPDSRLVFVGDGSEGKVWVDMARAADLGDRVDFRGTLRGSALHRAYEESSMVVLPSKYVPEDSSSETLGLTLIEGSMHSKPLVGTLHGGIPEIVKDGVNGFLVPEGNPAQLAKALRRILSDEDLAKKLGKNALEMAERKFTWNAATDRLLQSYVRRNRMAGQRGNGTDEAVR